jgi:hypothetical protein
METIKSISLSHPEQSSEGGTGFHDALDTDTRSQGNKSEDSSTSGKLEEYELEDFVTARVSKALNSDGQMHN